MNNVLDDEEIYIEYFKKLVDVVDGMEYRKMIANINQSENSRETIGAITRAQRKTFTVASYHIDCKAAKKKDVVSQYLFRLLGECVIHSVEAMCGDNNSGAFRSTNGQGFYTSNLPS